MTQQYRCIICQTVYPTVEAWREHARTTYGERVFEQAGFTVDPLPEDVVDMNDPAQRASVERGIIEVIAGRYPGRRNSDFSADVKTAIRALLVKDDDPYWMMSDDYSVRPKAALTEAGQAYARERGMLAPCADHESNGGACRREVLAPEFGGDNVRCSICRSSLTQYGAVEGLPFCGMCVVTVKRRTIPGWVIPPELRGRR